MTAEIRDTSQLKVGDMLGTVGYISDYQSTAINIGTGGIPGHSIHHVAQIARDEESGNLYVYESTMSERPPCAVRGVLTNGVQAVRIEDFLRIPFYKRVWVYPNRRTLYDHEQKRLNEYVRSMLGRSYDEPGAIHAGGFLFAAVSAMMRGEDLSSLFCSEFVAATRIHVGLLVAPNASWWAPNGLCRHVVRRGECGHPYRIK